MPRVKTRMPDVCHQTKFAQLRLDLLFRVANPSSSLQPLEYARDGYVLRLEPVVS